MGADRLSRYTPSDTTLGDYYVLELELPHELTEGNLEWAILELYLDVASVEKSGELEDTPAFEVYALKSDFSGTLEPSELALDPAPVRHDIPVGAQRKIMIDITAMVRSYLKDPTTNHGLILGSLTGVREGVFTIKEGIFGNGILGRLNFHHGNRVRG